MTGKYEVLNQRARVGYEHQSLIGAYIAARQCALSSPGTLFSVWLGGIEEARILARGGKLEAWIR